MMLRSSASSGVRGVCFFGLSICIAGCQSATIHLIPTDQQRLEPQEPLVLTQRADQAWFWTEDNQRVCIALARGNVLRKTTGARHTFALSLVLEGLPAGSGRDYRVAARGLRAVLHDGALHERYVSTRGIVRIWRDTPQRLSGRFRLTVVRHQFQVLTGWVPAGNILLSGEFRAALNPTRGRPILEQTERESLPRRATTTQPGEPREVSGPRPQTQPHQP
jgi:hypothetical protein